MSALFDEETVNELKKIFSGLRKNMKDVLIIDSLENPGITGEHHHHHDYEEEIEKYGLIVHCHTCGEAKLLADELTRISGGKLSFEVHDVKTGKIYNPRYLPAFIYDTPGRNVRYYGIPSGQEFAPFIFIHEYISEGVKLSEELVEEIEAIDTPLHVKVFVTPECPYCPLVVDFMNQVGVLNKNIIVETIEAFENPIEADRYGVQYVPFVAITRIEDYHVYGAKPLEVIPGYMPNEEMVEVIKKAAAKARKSK